MKIKDLIKKLKEYDENIDVCIYDREDKTYDDYMEFKIEICSYMIGKDGKIIGSRMNKTKEEAEKVAKLCNWNNVSYEDVLVIYPDY